MDKLVIIKKCNEYLCERIQKEIEDGLLLLGGIEKIINKNEKVLLKVNSLSSSKPETAVNTHPEFLRAVIRIIKKVTDEIYVGDSPAPGNNFKSASRKNGMLSVIEEEKVNLAEFKEEIEIESKTKLVIKKFKVDSLIRKVDKIINLPKLKTHTLMYLTLCVKNMYGILPGMRKPEFHLKAGRDKELFAKMLVDIYFMREPDLHIVDGIIGVEGNGPGTGGFPVKTGVILIGKNGFAVDEVAAKITGLNLNLIYTNNIYKTLILKNDRIEYEIKGEKIQDVYKKIKPPATDLKSNIPAFLYDFAKNIGTNKPVFIKKKCIGCLKCVNICPVKALIYEKNKGIKCNYEKCIRCFVCHEICPAKAIEVKKSILSFIFK